MKMRAFHCLLLVCATGLLALISGALSVAVTSRLQLAVQSPDVIETVSKRIISVRPTIQVSSNKSEEAEVIKKIQEANVAQPISKSQLEVNGKEIRVPQLKDSNSAAKDSKEVGETMGNFADTLQSVTNEDECDCNTKDSAKSVRKIIDATSRLSQDLLRCLLDSLKSTIKPKEATLIRSMVRESMDALSKSVEGIYTIWKMDIANRNLESVQTVVNGLMSVLNQFSSRLVTSMTANRQEKVQTVSFVVNQLIGLVANTSDALGADIDSGLSDAQLELAMNLSKELAEPLTSKVLAEFVNGTARIPAINKLVLRYYLQALRIAGSCENSKATRAQLPKSVFQALSTGLRSMSIRVGARDAGVAASESHRLATTNFLLSLVGDIERMLKGISRGAQVSEACMKSSAEALSNAVAIVKRINDDVIPELKDPKQRQQATVAGSITKDFADMIGVIGAELSRQGAGNYVSNVTGLIYQQFEIVRRVAKNDQAIGRDSEAGRKSTLTLLVDVARLEVKYVQLVIERVRGSRNTAMRATVLRNSVIEIIKSQVTVSRETAPANNKPLIDLIKSSGNALTETVLLLERSFEKRPHTFGDVIYEAFSALLEVNRKLISSASSPSRSGLATTVPSDVIFGAANAIRTTIDWANAMTRSSGMAPAIQGKLIRYVIEIIVSCELSLDENEKANQSLDRAAIGDLADIKRELQQIIANLERGVTTTTAASIDYEDYSDNSDRSPLSGISNLVALIHKLDEVLIYIIENNLRQPSSIVVRNSESVVNVLAVLLEDVGRTPHVNEDGSVDLPSGTLRPCTGGTNTGGSGISTTPMPSSPETRPPQTTSRAPTTQAPVTTPKGRDGDDGTTRRPHGPGTGAPSTRAPSGPITIGPVQPTRGPSTGRPSTRGPQGPSTGAPSTRAPGGPSSGAPSTRGPTGPGTNGPTTTRRPHGPGTGAPSTRGPSGPSTGAPSTRGPTGPSTNGPAGPSTRGPGAPGTGGPTTRRPHGPGTGAPSTRGPSGPSTNGPTTRRPNGPSTGVPSTRGPSGPSTNGPTTRRPHGPGTGAPSTRGPSGPSTNGPAGPSTRGPGAPGTGGPTTRRPNGPSTGGPSTRGPSGPSTNGPTTRRPHGPSTGVPSTRGPSGPSTGVPSTRGPNGPSTGGPVGPTTRGPGAPGTGGPTTRRPHGPGTGAPSTRGPGAPGTGAPTTRGPGAPGTGGPTTRRPHGPGTGAPSTRGPGAPGTGGPAGPSTRGPGAPGTGGPTTRRPHGPGTGAPTTRGPGAPGTGGPTTRRPHGPGTGAPSTRGPGAPSTSGPAGPSSTRGPNGPSTNGPAGPSTRGPGAPSTGGPTTRRPHGPGTGAPSTREPSGPSTGAPSTRGPGAPGTGGPTTRRPHGPGTGVPSTRGPGAPSTGAPSTRRPGSPSSTSRRPNGPSTGGPAGPTTTRGPGAPGTGGSSTRRPHGPGTGAPSTRGPNGPSTGAPSTRGPGATGTGAPGTTPKGRDGDGPDGPVTKRPHGPGHHGSSTTRPGSPGSNGSSTKPGNGSCDHNGSTGRPGNPITRGPIRPTTRGPSGPGNGTCGLMSDAAANASIKNLLRQAGLSENDINSLRAVLSRTLKEVTLKENCKSNRKDTTVSNENQLIVRVLQDIVKQKSCICSA